MDDKSVYLVLSNYAKWTYISKHWYGLLIFGDSRVELRRVLTARQAKRIDRDDGLTGKDGDEAWGTEAGSQTQRFYSRRAVIAAAKQQWRSLFPEADKLLLGHPAYEQHRKLDGI